MIAGQRGSHDGCPRPVRVMPVFQDPLSSFDRQWPVGRSISEPLLAGQARPPSGNQDGRRLARVSASAGTPRRGCTRLEVRHLRTRPYRPRTDGKAERFIQAMLPEWAFATVGQSSDQRREALESWLWRYNNHRLHSALGHKTPISRLRREDDWTTSLESTAS